MKLYSYYRSSAAYRVRIALNLKGISHQIVPVNLLISEQQNESYTSLNPQGLLPSIELSDGTILSQSGAILEWLEQCYPEPSLLPKDPIHAAKVRSLCHLIGCDIHPLNNLRVLKYLKKELLVTDTDKDKWYQHWVNKGFETIESQLSGSDFCYGSSPTLADCYLIPQIYNALRFSIDMSLYPKMMQVFENCHQLSAFSLAHPDQQSDNPNNS